MKRGNPPLLLHERWMRLGVVFGLLLSLTFIAFIRPQLTPTFLPKMPCGLRAITGLPCPFCGGTRAIRALLNGEWWRAIYLNTMAILALFIFVGVIGILLIEAGKARRLVDWKALERTVTRFMPLLIAFVMIWWLPHLIIALRTPKPELVNLKNPIAAKLRSLVY